MSEILTAALGYAAAGWPAFLLSRTKRPLANCENCPSDPPAHDPQGCRCLTCHGFYAATRDPKALRRMVSLVPGGMLAIRTGSPSGLVVVDVDPDHGGINSLTGLVQRGLCPPTRWVRTGSGGLHLYYRHPGPHTRIRCSAGLIAPGIDIRADGGYVIAPPSVHPVTRRPYTWADTSVPVVEMAPALITACQGTDRQPRPAATRPATTSSRRGAISNPDALLDALLTTVRTSGPGRRRVTLYGAARGVARIIAAGAISTTDGYTALLDVGLAVGQTEKSARAAILGGFRDEGLAA
ncbi:bifunctional DNA primase/polymerase [Micromonospora eburnea]|uniref:Bifunctional DNA primase/polymerase, N-terminal n=1 Tax=Micromonospora eburnea TaxID=227316 RepID=A0A1C6VF52_9ACTN|nr:bifunctional DNA primase/polymerase [Micromonospora eburnea]SCL64905.1 Bifunctional DNA primase/polymerase, N-terminal [Micromonospora eburnea]